VEVRYIATAVLNKLVDGAERQYERHYIFAEGASVGEVTQRINESICLVPPVRWSGEMAHGVVVQEVRITLVAVDGDAGTVDADDVMDAGFGGAAGQTPAEYLERVWKLREHYRQLGEEGEEHGR